MPRHSAIYSGQVVDQTTGRGVPAIVEPSPLGVEKAGYPPTRLDAIIERLIDNVDSGAELLQRYTPMLGALMEELQTKTAEFLQGSEPDEVGRDIKPELAQMLSVASQVSMIMERLNKMTMNAVRAKDDASRLRSFLAGDVDRKDLEHLGENDLRRIVADAASGWVKPEDSDGA